MEIENTSLWAEVLAILDAPPNKAHNSLSATIHIVDANIDYPVIKVIEYDVVSDYVGKYTDAIVAHVMIPLGDYAYLIYPNRNKLEMSVSFTPNNVTGEEDTTEGAADERYVAFIVDTKNPVIDITSKDVPGINDLNRHGFVNVHIQMLDKMAYALRVTELGCICRNCNVEDAVKAIMTNESQKILVDANLALKGVDMVKASNTAIRKHINIPQGTRLVDVPNYVHSQQGGIYTAGLGYYLHKGYWYIYPAYDVTRINTTPKTITIINIPENKLPGTENTYADLNGTTMILATGKIKYNDTRRADQQNKGNGVRYTDADVFMGKFYRTVGNKADTQQANNTNEYVVDKSPDGWVNAPISQNAITSNNFKELSRIAPRRGAFITLTWDYPDPDVIYPGILAKIHYISDGVVSEIAGILVHKHLYVRMMGEGITGSRYKPIMQLVFFVEGLGD